MKLIAESGSTKTRWCGISGPEETEIISTTGLNPNFVDEKTIAEVISASVVPLFSVKDIDTIWFYGAGCSGEAMVNKVKNAISLVLPDADIQVFSDLTGAARGLLGRSKGYVCMIGTGSNSGYYDGERITMNVPPLGFILGDEGSGASLGKKLLADYLRGIMPAALSEEFREKYGAEKDDIVGHVYRGVFPGRFIGGFVQFLNDHISEEYCKNLVKRSFEEFVERNLKLYNAEVPSEIALTGSVAWYFRHILVEVLSGNGFTVSVIAREPIQGLIRFHKTDV
jgi:N-acetylglucosamine kinase-like BadF-type ATPase